MRAEEAAIVQVVRDANPSNEWNTIEFNICANVGAYSMDPRWDIDAPGPDDPQELVLLLMDLRKAMADPEMGAWLTAKIVIPRVGDAHFSYDWMTKPSWDAIGGELDDPLYQDDLAEFPRTPENIPGWYPC